MVAVILAGGVGSRFWPKSRESKPKQFLQILSDESMLQMSFTRAEKLVGEGNVWIVSGSRWREQILEQLPRLDPAQLIEEPAMRNTAPAIALAAIHVRKDDPIMAVFPSDHFIPDTESFVQDFRRGAKFLEEKPALLTFGIPAVSPSTGYGYIQVARIDNGIQAVQKFHEKPNLERALEYVSSGKFYWNSGMFLWRSSVYLEHLRKFLPEDFDRLDCIAQSIGQADYRQVLEENWKQLSGISVDYGILEKADDVFCCPANFRWSDIGSWDALHNELATDVDGNVKLGNVLLEDSVNCFFHSDAGFLAGIGLEDLIVVQSADATLVVNCKKSEDLKLIYDKISKQYR